MIKKLIQWHKDFNCSYNHKNLHLAALTKGESIATLQEAEFTIRVLALELSLVSSEPRATRLITKARAFLGDPT